MAKINIPLLNPAKISPVNEIAPVAGKDFSVAKINNVINGLSNTVVPVINQSMQAAANAKVTNEFMNEFLVNLDKVKQKHLKEKDYVGYRGAATAKLNEFFSKFSSPYERKTIEQIRNQKVAWLAEDILRFENELTRENEAKTISETLQRTTKDIQDNPDNISTALESLESLRGNFNLLTGSPLKGFEMHQRYKEAVTSAGMLAKIDQATSLSDLQDYYKENNANLSPSDRTRFKIAIQKRADIARKTEENIQKTNDIINKKVGFSPRDTQQTKLLNEAVEAGLVDGEEVAYSVGYLTRPYLNQLNASLGGGGLNGLEAARKIVKMSKALSSLDNQIPNDMQNTARKVLARFSATGDIDESFEYAFTPPKLSKEEQALRKTAANQILKDVTPTSIIDGWLFQSGNDIRSYRNSELIAEYRTLFNKAYVEDGLNEAEAKNQAKANINKIWGITKYSGTTSIGSFRKDIAAKMPIEKAAQDAIRKYPDLKEPEDKEWFLDLAVKLIKKELYINDQGKLVAANAYKNDQGKVVVIKSKTPDTRSEKELKKTLFFEWDEMDPSDPTYYMMTYYNGSYIPVMVNNTVLTFKPDLEKYYQLMRKKNG